MRRRRRLWIILLATPLVLLGADTLYWRFAVRSLEDGFAAWESSQRAAGWTIAHRPAERGGWPLSARLIIPAVSLEGGGTEIPGGLAWSTDRLVLRVALTQPGLLDSAAEGQQRLRLGGDKEVPYSAEQLHLVLPLQAEQWPDFADVRADGIRANAPGTGDISVQTLRAHVDFASQGKSGEQAMAFALQVEGISAPPSIARPLGSRVARLALEGILNGPLPVARTLAERAAAWRDGGGSLELSHLALVWGPLDLSGSATLALDDQLQPMGAGSAHIVGYAETLDALATRGAISRSAATAAKAVLSLLAHSPDAGGPPDVDVPLTLQYRTLSMRQVPLLRLPEVDWP
jgi:hypothetical protein